MLVFSLLRILLIIKIFNETKEIRELSYLHYDPKSLTKEYISICNDMNNIYTECIALSNSLMDKINSKLQPTKKELIDACC
jgi:hypothetical protein